MSTSFRRLVGIALVTLLTLSSILALSPGRMEAAGPAGPQGYLIGSTSPLTAAQVNQLKAAGVQVKHVYKNFGGAAGVIAPQNLAKVRALPFVTSVNEDTIKQLDLVQVASAFTSASNTASALPGDPYWLDLIDREQATAYDGSGVWVAVLDSGFYPNWRDYFKPESILTQYANAFVAAAGNENQNQWDVGSDPHGMAVSATIVGYWLRDKQGEGGFGQGYTTGAPGTYWVPGVAEGAKIIPVKVCEPIGCFGSAINAGIDHITSLKKANPAQPIVINESLGGPGLDAVEKAAIDSAIAAGVVLVASAGNSGNAGMGFPAAYEPVISVGAGGWTQQWSDFPSNTWWLNDVPEDDMSQIYVAGFSSREKPLKVGKEEKRVQYLDVVSTGRYLLLPYPCAELYKDGQVTNGTAHRTCASKATPDSAQSAPYQYLFISGTSFSGPTVAGIVALMLEKNSTISNADAITTNTNDNKLDDPSTWRNGAVERMLEGSATPIDPGWLVVTHRDGTPLLECWEVDLPEELDPADPPKCQLLEATGYGWVFADDALDAVP